MAPLEALKKETVSPLLECVNPAVAALPTDTATVAEEVVRHFGSLQALLGASLADLLGVPAVDPAAARVIRDGLGRLAESYDRFDLPG